MNKETNQAGQASPVVIHNSAKLADWLAKLAVDKQTGTFGDSLSIGFTFPLQSGETVSVHKGFRSRGQYLRRGTLIAFAGLTAYAVLFTLNGKYLTVQHDQLINLCRGTR